MGPSGLYLAQVILVATFVNSLGGSQRLFKVILLSARLNQQTIEAHPLLQLIILLALFHWRVQVLL